MKDAVITFLKSKNPYSTELSEEDEIFSFFYSKVIEAENYCLREGLRHCYIGYRNFTWLIQTSPKNLLYPIEITDSGIKTDLPYIITPL